VKINLQRIGTVHRLPDETCRLDLDRKFAEGLLGVEPGMRLDVLYWMHELSEEKRRQLQCHPRGDRSRPIRGVFALRSPMRPNPIGVTTVEVLEVDGTTLRVSGLDAEDGSPVIDLKMARS